jgi:hypothetical protein|tara:strand:+ start:95 stop:205 length:111 start_codon:yes stop_codon:yes gene_type:complete
MKKAHKVKEHEVEAEVCETEGSKIVCKKKKVKIFKK